MTDHPPERERSRLPAIDVVRGFVMVLMTLDHSSGSFNGVRSMADGAATFHPDMVFEPLQFVARWVTHLCAPTFVFLAGMSLALSVRRRQRSGTESSIIDRDILIRGVLLIVFDVGWMGWMWRLGWPLQFGVLYAIGMSMIGMIALRRLPAVVVGGLGVAVMVGGEAVTSLLDPTTTLAAATMTGGQIGSLYYLYPFLPWTGFLMVGWALGMRIGGPGMRARDWLALAGIAAVTFVIVRGTNGYGNAHLLRRDGSWIEWLHVSKYPPSLAFAALELGIMFMLLAAAWRWRPPRIEPLRPEAQDGSEAPRREGPAWGARAWKPLMVLGQTALFYYLIHAHLFKAGALALGIYKTQGLGTTMVGWGAMLLLLYPVCRWYLGVKRRYPHSVLRFV